jgi:hypothetical protein
MIDALTEMYPDIPICMHQDHGNNEATCMTRDPHGFTSVMMDGSLEADMKTPASYDYNVEITERWRGWPTGSAPRWRASSACSARSRPARRKPRTARAPRQALAMTSC